MSDLTFNLFDLVVWRDEQIELRKLQDDTDTTEEAKEAEQDSYDFWVHENDPVYQDAPEPSDAWNDF
jgi:hypothetical protein